MTEEEWLGCSRADKMFDLLQANNPRAALASRLRLFMCGCCGLMPEASSDHPLNEAIDTVIRHASGKLTLEEFNQFCQRIPRNRYGQMPRETVAEQARNRLVEPLAEVWDSTRSITRLLIENCVEAVHPRPINAGRLLPSKLRNEIKARIRETACRLIRCVFCNPFRPVAADPRWRTPTVTALATGVYADRAFDRLPILADALEDAGCDNADVLAHCRGPGPHVRGCWVVDMMLGKT